MKNNRPQSSKISARNQKDEQSLKQFQDLAKSKINATRDINDIQPSVDLPRPTFLNNKAAPAKTTVIKPSEKSRRPIAMRRQESLSKANENVSNNDSEAARFSV